MLLLLLLLLLLMMQHCNPWKSQRTAAIAVEERKCC
jgi:hypothetical protein